ncbi:MAG TPA: transglutaminase-like domain-containing protein [Dehalococcoidia bacterium]|nr:transglutaminase-like domain-containing protein [Dehalococcoidia bacterium]
MPWVYFDARPYTFQVNFEGVSDFKRAVSGRPEEIDLFGAAIAIASLSGNRPDRSAVSRELDAIASGAISHAGGAVGESGLSQAIDFQLFTKLRFRGAVEGYGDPENSFLDRVIERRVGIPISLSLVYMQVAERIGLHSEGVGYPGHFLVRVGQRESAFFVDPFNQGARLDTLELKARLESVELGGARADMFLVPVTHRQLLQRILNNLRRPFRRQRDVRCWRDTIELALCIEPWNHSLVGERGMLSYRLGDLSRAVGDLEQFVESMDGQGAS